MMRQFTYRPPLVMMPNARNFSKRKTPTQQIEHSIQTMEKLNVILKNLTLARQHSKISASPL